MLIKDSIIKQPRHTYTFPQAKEKILFFDIETTGLSPKASSLYMIGIMFFDKKCSAWHIQQFFADNYKSEPDIILSFLEVLHNYKYLYHFNGKTFDIPYILDKCVKYGIKPDSHCLSVLNDKDNIYSIDLLALIRPLKKLLSIQSAAQTSLERWLGIMRKDRYDGGQLISVYSQYMQFKLIAPDKAPELEKLLLLHNHDDIMHMLDVCSILSYWDLFSAGNNITITDITPGSSQHINITFRHNIQIPKKIYVTKPFPSSKEETIPIQDIHLETGKNSAVLSVPLFYGNLKYFYPGYKKAAASKCYEAKEGIFVPSLTLIQPESYNTQYYITYRDKVCFYALPDERVDIYNPFWSSYVQLQLGAFIHKKAK
ncbi:MAG: ribonuclease H-like domain-containing protein [Lachnospiraceae bacterium]|nr:ribonuclease H-like domain-containing protein [Lachnospiraceae bacterium]